jgi:hypothetical protein
VRERVILPGTLTLPSPSVREREIFRNPVTLTLPSPSVREREIFPKPSPPEGERAG